METTTPTSTTFTGAFRTYGVATRYVDGTYFVSLDGFRQGSDGMSRRSAELILCHEIGRERAAEVLARLD